MEENKEEFKVAKEEENKNNEKRKKKIKKAKEKKIITKKTTIIMIVSIILLIFGIVYGIYYKLVTPSRYITSTQSDTSTTTIYSDTDKNTPTNSNTDYEVLKIEVYNTLSSTSTIDIDNLFITTSASFKNYFNYLDSFIYDCYNDGTEEIFGDQSVLEFFDEEFFEENNLAIFMYDGSYSNHHYSIASVVIDGSTGTINIEDDYHTYGGVLAPCVEISFIILDKSITTANFDIYRTTTENYYEICIEGVFYSSIAIIVLVILIVIILVKRHNKNAQNDDNDYFNQNKLKKISGKEVGIVVLLIVLLILLIFSILYFFLSLTSTNTSSYKPIIYLYPEEETEVTVSLGNSDLITCSYPKYTDGWNVLAYPNGDLIDLDTNRSLYSLYYESTNAIEFKVENEGFVVAGEDTAEFLEEKLEILGLTQREAEEFIIYWLPKLEENEYNYIRFATYEELEENMPLEIDPEPDTIIRILMTYKGLDEPIEVEEQILETPERTGFVAVEWGGTEIE